MKSTQNTNVATVVKNTDEKLTAEENKKWSAMVVARVNQQLKARSVNKILWSEDNKNGD